MCSKDGVHTRAPVTSLYDGRDTTMLSSAALSRASDRRILEYFISLNAAAADQWEGLGVTAEHPQVRDLFVETAGMQRKLVEGLSDMLPRFLQAGEV